MKPSRTQSAAPARWPILLALPLALSACSITQEIEQRTKIDYKSAAKLPPLDVPPDLVSPRGDERYTIPEREQRTFSGYQSARTVERPQAADSKVLPAVEGMRIERAGTQRWLVVAQPAEKLWPMVKEFWQESGFVLQSESPATGVMETEWAENRAKIPQDIIRRTVGRLFESVYSTSERDKFRTRFEAVTGGTEIYISHRGMQEVFANEGRDRTMWQPRPVDPDLEAEFLRRLMVRLGADTEQSGQAAGAASTEPQTQLARVVTGPAGDTLEVREAFDRAWRRIGLALDRGGFTVEDRDRSQGVYFVRYIDPELVDSSGEKKGLLSRLFSRGPSKPTSAQQYRIRVEGDDSLSRVTVLDKDGGPLGSENDRKTAAKIVALLREQLAQ